MDTKSLLAKCFLFRGLPDDELGLIAGIAEPRDLIAGETVFLAGEPGDAMFLIRVGEVVVEKESQKLATLSTGSHFGEVALLDKRERSATVKAKERTAVLEIGRERFEALMEGNPTLAAHVYVRFCRYLCSRLRRTNEQMVYFKEMAEG